MATRRVKWNTDGDRVTVSLRDSTGYVMLVTVPAEEWRAADCPDSGEVADDDEERDAPA
jgi:hypothetical protein